MARQVEGHAVETFISEVEDRAALLDACRTAVQEQFGLSGRALANLTIKAADGSFNWDAIDIELGINGKVEE
jgi:hypothetical protein